MSKFIVGASVTLALALPAVAQAKPPTPQHVRQYLHLRAEVVRKDGKRAPGRNIVRWGLSNHHKATDADVMKSNGIFYRALHPQPKVVPVSHIPVTVTSTAQMVGAVLGSTVSAAPVQSQAPAPGGLTSCIIQHESGGNSQAVSPGGTYMGIGQWQESTWVADGGTRYSQTPLGASYSQQYQVLQSEGAGGMQQQQGQYDGC